MATKSQAQLYKVSERDRLLEEIQDRVLWLAIHMVDYANNKRPNPGGLKVGGHQSSSSSVVTIMTYLYFEYMNPGDKVSVKPHASPVYHAIQYLLGNLDAEYLKTLRGFHGLQAYPSRVKDPDGVDFTTGSVGLGAVAPNFGSLTEEYVRSHMRPDSGADRRYISLVGDAELDEGSVWEAISEPLLRDIKNVVWVVDLNRQSLDRIIPGIRVGAWREMFAANGWRVIDAKYGSHLKAAFSEPRGELLRMSIDEMPNETYQRLLRVDSATLREWLPRTTQAPEEMKELIGRWEDDELQTLFRNLGGHDFGVLREAFNEVDLQAGPNVIFAYTLKGWKLPSIGDPHNHSVNLTQSQVERLREEMGIPEDALVSGFQANSDAATACEETGNKLRLGKNPPEEPPQINIPAGFGNTYAGMMSTQQIFGLVLTNISRATPDLSERVVTVSPDVASSTNLGGWINKAAVWGRDEKEAMPEEEQVRALQWVESPRGQHIELGISENNLFMMLGQLGVTFETTGEILFPIGTLYDPFVRRGLDAFVYAVYSGARFIIVGTPSGVTLGPEGGSHQSLMTPSIGAELPDLAYYEPCFGQELEWIVLAALEKIRTRENSTYLRLTSMRMDQGLFKKPSDPEASERLRQQVLAGAYRLVDRSTEDGYGRDYNIVNIMASGAIVPEAVAASDSLLREGVFANVINITGPGPLYSRFQKKASDVMKRGGTEQPFMADIFSIGERSAPIVTVVDGHPHSLAWIGAAMKTPTFPLGVTKFGQSGNPPDLYREYEIDAESIMAACFGALGI